MVNFPPPSPENVVLDSEVLDSEEEVDGLAEQEPLDLKWIQVCGYEVAVCPLPGNRMGGARRSLVADLATLKEEKITDVYVLCTKSDLHRARVPTLLEEYHKRGFVCHHYPLDDEHAPDMQHCLDLLESLYLCLGEGRKTAVHCTDGFGRSCLVLVLLAMLMDPDLPAVLAIEYIRGRRGRRAIQTIKQYNFIMDFRKDLAEFKQAQHRDPPRPALASARPPALSAAN